MAEQGEMPVLWGWKARRSGGRITITHSTGKVSSVDEIECTGGGALLGNVPLIVATDSKGKRYRLSTG